MSKVFRRGNFPVRIGEYFRIQDSRGYPYNPIFKRTARDKVQLIESFTGSGKLCVGEIFNLIDDDCGWDITCKLIYRKDLPHMRFHIRKGDYRVLINSICKAYTQSNENKKEVKNG